MNTNFDFATSSRIIFGTGRINELGQILKGMGNNLLLITGGVKSINDTVYSILKNNSIEIAGNIQTRGEPNLNFIGEAITEARNWKIDHVLGIGGGSVIDTAKAVAALITNPGDIIDYLEVVGNNAPLKVPSIPLVVVPTTSGTGSEVTRNSVISVPEKQVKVSLRSSFLLPRVALIDPELTLSLPPQFTASTGLDAFTQLLEPFVSIRGNLITDMFCQEGLEKVSRSLKQAYRHGDDILAREDMSWGSLLGGLALANSGLGAVHGFAAAIGGKFNAPHGTLCARLLPGVISMNFKALYSRQPNSEGIEKYLKAFKIITGGLRSPAEDGIKFIRDLTSGFMIPGLAYYGISINDLPEIIDKTKQTSSMKGNPVKLSDEELLEILEEAL